MYVIQILKPREAMSRNARCAFLWVFLSDTALNYLLRPDLSILGYVKGAQYVMVQNTRLGFFLNMIHLEQILK